MKRFFVFFLLPVLVLPVRAQPIQWVNFKPNCEAMKIALDADIASYGAKHHCSWIDILAVAACRSGGECTADAVKQAAAELKTGASPKKILKEQHVFYDYYHEAYTAVLGGLVGKFAIEKDGKWITHYGLKAYSPIAEGYPYSHVSDYGAPRSYGYSRPHLGNDLMGDLGTPIVAVETGTVEAIGWNPYGGWRVGIRSLDRKRYCYYAHMRKDAPYAPGLKEGDLVRAGDVIGFMGRTGYSDEENVNNIEWVHLHFGMQLIFEESQKDCDHEIWIDTYEIVRLLRSHRSSVAADRRVYAYRDLDWEEIPQAQPVHPSVSGGNSSWRSLETSFDRRPA